MIHENASERWNAASNLLKFRARATAAEVCKSPASIANEGGVVLSLIEQVGDRVDGTSCDNDITHSWVVSGEVAESPDCLLNDLKMRGRQESDKRVNSAFVQKNLHVLVVSTSHVGEAPGSLKLEFRDIAARQERYKSGDQVRINHALNWGLVFEREQTAEANGSELKHQVVLGLHQFEELVEIANLEYI